MDGVVIFGVGSPLVVDIEESLGRSGIIIAAAVRNRSCPVYLINKEPLIDLSAVTDEIRAKPFLVPLFTPGHRQQAVLEAQEVGFHRAFCWIDASVARPRSLAHGEGLFINSGCSLGGASEMGDFVMINRGASIGHHARLGRFASIGPGAVLAGQITVGDGAVIGAGAVILPSIRIGANAVVGAGAVVTRDVPAHCQVLGHPAQITKQAIKGYADREVA